MIRFLDSNVEAVMKGELNPDMLRELIETWQRVHELKVDGLAGPQTRGAITLALMAKQPKRPAAPSILPAIPLQMKALAVAVSELGRGEDPALGNNEGADIDRYKLSTGLYVPGSNAWCAIFLSYCFRQAAGNAPLPFLLASGAKKLVKNIGEAGRFITTPEPGAVIAWHRGIKLDWRGHVGIIESVTGDTVTTIEGNKNVAGSKTAKVARFSYPAGKWLDRMYKMATL